VYHRLTTVPGFHAGRYPPAAAGETGWLTAGCCAAHAVAAGLNQLTDAAMRFGGFVAAQGGLRVAATTAATTAIGHRPAYASAIATTSTAHCGFRLIKTKLELHKIVSNASPKGATWPAISLDRCPQPGLLTL
jgi:hypothetical protein